MITVVAAIIRDASGRILATQRGYGDWKDFWEFPGGKIEPGEKPEDALRRELREEMDAQIVIDRLLQTVDYDYPTFHITLHCYLCRLADERFVLKEHEAARWLTPEELSSVQWLPADQSVIAQLQNLHISKKCCTFATSIENIMHYENES